MMKTKRADLMVLGALVIIGLLLVLILFLTDGRGARVVVSVGGEETAVFSLDEETEWVIEGRGGCNVLEIRDGKARIAEADCPDKLGARSGWISRRGQSILCLPHQVVVEIRDEKTEGPDIVIGTIQAPGGGS